MGGEADRGSLKEVRDKREVHLQAVLLLQITRRRAGGEGGGRRPHGR